jgi:hypothetical protein
MMARYSHLSILDKQVEGAGCERKLSVERAQRRLHGTIATEAIL